MRIEKTDMEFVTFDAQDVIMTSTPGGHDDDVLTMIWLSLNSIDNFNLQVPQGNYYLNIGEDHEDYAWVAYDGSIGPKKNPTRYTSVSAQDEIPSSGIYVVTKDNQTEYNTVLSWLQNHSKQ